MSDLIDRKYAIKRFCEDGTYLERHGVGVMSLCEAKQRAVELIESFPSAQPTCTDEEIQRMQELDSAQIQKAYEVGYEVGYEEGNKERKNGKWIEKEHSPFYCSVCGTYQYSASWEIKNKEYNFCPSCGARMDGENE